MKKQYCFFSVIADSELGRKLDKLQQDYANGNKEAKDAVLKDALSLLEDKIEKVARVYSRRMIPKEEFISALHEAVWTAFKEYKPGKASFTTYLTLLGSRAVADVYRAHGAYAEKCVLASAATPSEDDDFSAVSGEITYFDGLATSRTSTNYATDEHFDMISDARDVEADVLDRMMVEKLRELIAYLYDKVDEIDKADKKFRKLDEKFREDARRFMTLLYAGCGMSDEELRKLARNIATSRNKVADICGISHSRVDRVFNYLSRLFDSEKFGELEDYLFRATDYPRLSEACATCKLPPERRRKHARKKKVEATKAVKTTRKCGKRS